MDLNIVDEKVLYVLALGTYSKNIFFYFIFMCLKTVGVYWNNHQTHHTILEYFKIYLLLKPGLL